jgi:hypothetical protein
MIALAEHTMSLSGCVGRGVFESPGARVIDRTHQNCAPPDLEDPVKLAKCTSIVCNMLQNMVAEYEVKARTLKGEIHDIEAVAG